jgi:hypothetical protein
MAFLGSIASGLVPQLTQVSGLPDPRAGQFIPAIPQQMQGAQAVQAPQPIATQPIANVPQTGLIGSEQALRGGLQASVGALEPFTAGGAGATNIQAALTGALGPEAQSQAFTQFQQDPGTRFLQEQGEQAVLRGSSAIGGLGGGNVRRALTRFGQGLAQQGLQQRFQNLGDVAQRGLGASTNVADLLRGTARDVSQGRLQTGRDIAQQIGGTTSALSDLISRQGAGLADITGTGGVNLANLLQGAGAAQAGGQTDLATILANIATQQGSTVAGLPSASQLLTGQGLLQPIGQAASGIGTAILAASDIRLKTNIQRTGQTPSGINLYKWDWTEEGREIVGDQPAFGVMAQEVMEMTPEAVMMYPDGYYRVDYARIH